MTLTRLVLAWVPVAVWFLVATIGITFLADGPGAGLPVPLLKWRPFEAVLLTLFGSLWFDSLGSGEWWVVFLLVGVIAAIPSWLTFRGDPARPVRRPFIGACADVARYVLAGAILAWRLG